MSKESKNELKYRIEALEEEIKYLELLVDDKQNRVVELIRENDRLTMTYEPYRPPGDEHEGLDFYSLIEENDSLTNNILDKMEVIAEQDEEIRELYYTIDTLNALIDDLRTENQELSRPTRRKPKKVGIVSLDFWPLRDWWRFSYHKWSPGMAMQLCVGPVRFDWFAD